MKKTPGMKRRRILAGITALLVLVVVALAALHWRERGQADELVRHLLREPLPAQDRPVSLDSMGDLPMPVLGYFRQALTDRQAPICTATLQQAGELRTDTVSDNWMAFSATEIVVPGRGFAWYAHIALPYGAHLRVLDSFDSGTGSGRVSVMTTMSIGEDRDNPQLNSGALHRYLAEAVWFPTALLPQSGVRWSPIDESHALATLTVDDVTVSLEFRFDERHEIESVYSPERWGTFGEGYEQRPWKGHFRDYQEVQGMRIPRHGEVGWYTDEELQIVWRGTIEDASFAMCGLESTP